MDETLRKRLQELGYRKGVDASIKLLKSKVKFIDNNSRGYGSMHTDWIVEQIVKEMEELKDG